MKKITGIVAESIVPTSMDPLILKVKIKNIESDSVRDCRVIHNPLGFLCSVASSYLITVTGRDDPSGTFIIKDFTVHSQDRLERETI